MADKVQKGTAFLKTHTAEQIAELMASGHPPFREEVNCDETDCKDCCALFFKMKKQST